MITEQVVLIVVVGLTVPVLQVFQLDPQMVNLLSQKHRILAVLLSDEPPLAIVAYGSFPPE